MAIHHAITFGVHILHQGKVNPCLTVVVLSTTALWFVVGSNTILEPVQFNNVPSCGEYTDVPSLRDGNTITWSLSSYPLRSWSQLRHWPAIARSLYHCLLIQNRQLVGTTAHLRYPHVSKMKCYKCRIAFGMSAPTRSSGLIPFADNLKVSIPRGIASTKWNNRISYWFHWINKLFNLGVNSVNRDNPYVSYCFN